MLPRRSRIPRASFAELQGSRRFKSSAHFTLRVSDAGAKTPKAAVSVSKKVSKSAVVRNAIRRRAYAVLSKEIANLKSGLYLFVAKKGAEEVRGELLRKELADLLNSA